MLTADRSGASAAEGSRVRTRITALAALALVGLAHAASGVSAPPSAQIQEKNAQVNALDTRVGALVDAWDGAKIQLATTEKQLAANRAQLSVAQKQSLIAQRRAEEPLSAKQKDEDHARYHR